MKYQNRQPEEGINLSPNKPVKLFLQLLVSTLLLFVVSIFVLYVSGAWLAKKIPFRAELAIMDQIDYDFDGSADDQQIVEYLNSLSARIAEHLPNPHKVDYTVHYSSNDTFNAFATIGGNIIFYEGLLSKLPNENALAMVMAHEMAHVAHRDPVAGLGGVIPTAIALSVFTGSGGEYAASLINDAGSLTAMQFTRKMENNADDAAILAVSELYGHTLGADGLFKLMIDEGENLSEPDWFARFKSTHPLDADRVKNVAKKAQEYELSTEGELTPLPGLW